MDSNKFLKSKGREIQERGYNSGRVFSSMCSTPLDVAVKAYVEFLKTNLLDEELFPDVKILEKKAIRKIAALFSNSEAGGYITSGGTEGNIAALWVARKLSGGKSVIAPISAHYSIDKACDLQQIDLIHTEVDNNYRATIDDINEKASSKTIAIVVAAGTVALGIVDPIEQIAEIAEDHRCFLHVDASFGGFVLPFLENSPPRWDFSVGGVASITADPHKMGLAPIPAGSVLFRKKEWLKAIEIEAPYLSRPSATVLGTRPGASAAAVWAALSSLGHRGYRKIVKRCMTLTKRLADGIKRTGIFDLVVEPELNIVAFKSDLVKPNKLKLALMARGWVISTNTRPESARMVVMPHHQRNHITSFLSDLKECAEELA